MTVTTVRDGTWNPWRLARWGLAVALLLTPLVMMQISDEWHWGVGSFVFAGVLIGGVGLLYELAEKASGSRAYRAGAAIALFACLATVWTTIVRDDDNGIGFLMIVLAVAVSAFAAWFRAAGMARAMLGVAGMHALLSIAIATAPVVARIPGRSAHFLMAGGVFTLLWLLSAILFAAAAKRAASQ